MSTSDPKIILTHQQRTEQAAVGVHRLLIVAEAPAGAEATIGKPLLGLSVHRHQVYDGAIQVEPRHELIRRALQFLAFLGAQDRCINPCCVHFALAFLSESARERIVSSSLRVPDPQSVHAA